MLKRAAARTGRRELNKEDKLRRIRDAARKLFVANGYDEASTRQIAVNAGVALGTLFLYASNKRDLLFLVVNDDLEKVADRAVAAARPDAALIENLIAVFRPLYEFFGKEPRLSRLTLREMMFYESGPQAKRFLNTRQRMIDLCKDLVRIAQSRNEIKTSDRYRRAGEVLYAIFQIEIRKWLTVPGATVEDGLQSLREGLDIVITGLSKEPRR
ncbi:MAG: helix-turn-helix domain-containing protein [Xanthobacteraceae bacterium]